METQSYEILKSSHAGEKGEIVSMTPNAAKYLISGGIIKPVRAVNRKPDSASPAKKRGRK